MIVIMVMMAMNVDIDDGDVSDAGDDMCVSGLLFGSAYADTGVSTGYHLVAHQSACSIHYMPNRAPIAQE